MTIRSICLPFSILLLPQLLCAEVTLDLYGGLSNTEDTNVDIALYDYAPAKTGSEPINGSSNIYGIRVVKWLDYYP